MQIDAIDLIELGRQVTLQFRGQTICAQADRNSGYVFFPPPDTEMLADYYQNEYQKSSENYYTVRSDYETAKNCYHADRILDAYTSFADKLPATSFELGCAYGGLVAEMARRGIDAHGSDINEGAIASGRKEMGNMRIASATNLDAYAQIADPVDLIYSLHVLEHDPSLIDVLRHAKPALSENGLVYVSVPNAMYVASVLRGFPYNPWVNYPQHLHMLSPGFLPALCEEVGFVPLYWDSRVFFGADPELTGIFARESMSDDLAARLEMILGQGGFGMELNFLAAPKDSKLALKYATDAAVQLASLERQRRNEVVIRNCLRQPL